jgi:propanediol dehydratase small subunit
MSHTDTHHIHPTYPLMDHQGDELQAASGRPLAEVDLATKGLAAEDLQISADTLRAQAEIARQAGYPQLAANLIRAAELTVVPNQELLRMYETLRPGRATYAELEALAHTLLDTYQAPENARLVREAAAVYRQRGMLRRT